MKITPLEIRQKTFEKALRGYNKEEVSAFLITLSQEWEHMQDDLKQMHTRLNSQEREINKLREMEGALHKTLKAAERASANAVDQANKQAELQLTEARLQAGNLLKKAELDADNIVTNSEKTASQILAEMEYELKETIQHYKTIVNAKKDLERELNHTINEVKERVNSLHHQANDFDPDQYLSRITAKHNKTTNTNVNMPSAPDETGSTYAEKKQPNQEDQTETSFFDQI